jgi:hypothetical protein
VNIHKILHDPILGNSFGDLMTRQNSSSYGLTTNDAHTTAGIVLDTTHIRKYSAPNFDNYTFKIVQDSIEEQTLLRNYQLTVVNDTTLIQFLIDYPINTDKSIDYSNAVFTRIPGNDLLPFSIVESSCGGISYGTICHVLKYGYRLIMKFKLPLYIPFQVFYSLKINVI